MPNDIVYFVGDWWEPEATDSEPCAVEVDRTDDDEVALHIRGVSGGDDYGAVYLTRGNAKRLMDELRDMVTRKWGDE